MSTRSSVVTLLCVFLASTIAVGEAQLSKVDEGTHSLASMNEALTYVRSKAKQAQDSRDPIKLNCVNEKAAQIAALVSVAQNSLDDLRQFMASGEFEAADHELEKINIAKSKVDGYKADADACVGQIEVGDGKAVVIYNPGNVEQQSDPTQEVPPDQTAYRPATASPSQ